MNSEMHEPQGEVDVVPSVAPTAYAYRYEGNLYIEEGAELPTDSCICCGKKSVKTVEKPLRSPFKPATWFGTTRKVEIGLCPQHKDSKMMGMALTYSILGVGLAIFITGVVTLSIISIVLGLIAIAVSGIFQAKMPVYAADPREEPVQIKGAGDRFLESIPVATVEEG